MRAALDEELLATDLADYLVRKGMPFREAHHIVGEVVQLASESQSNLSALPLTALQAICELFSQDVYDVFDFDKSVAKRSVFGGTAPSAVREQIALAKESVGG